MVGNNYFADNIGVQYYFLLNHLTMNKFFDLRFVIGLFFSAVGILLLGYGFLTQNKMQDVNRWCGGIFTLFGVIMIILSYQKEKEQKVLDK